MNGDVTVDSVASEATIQIKSGVFSVAATSSTRGLWLTGGQLAGDGTFTITSSLIWSGGGMAGSGKTMLSTSATASIAGTAGYLSRTMDNAGTLSFGDFAILEFGRPTGETGVLNNLPGQPFPLLMAIYSRTSGAAAG